MTSVPRNRLLIILGAAIALTTAAELFYLVVWGLWLFPAGSLLGKIAWTLTCGVAMGAVIGASTLLWVEGQYLGRAAFARAALVMATVGSYCALLCSRIDHYLEYFGGAENGTLFLLAGVIPAIFGGSLYAWLLYGRHAPFEQGAL